MQPSNPSQLGGELVRVGAMGIRGDTGGDMGAGGSVMCRHDETRHVRRTL